MAKLQSNATGVMTRYLSVPEEDDGCVLNAKTLFQSRTVACIDLIAQLA